MEVLIMKLRKIDRQTVNECYAKEPVDRFKNRKSETRLAIRGLKTAKANN